MDFLHIEEVLVLREIVETAASNGDNLNPLPTATPAPSPTPSPTPDANAVQPISPSSTEEIFVYPQVGSDNKSGSSHSNGSAPLESLPEDEWVEN